MTRLTVRARDLRAGDILISSRAIVTRSASVGISGKADLVVRYPSGQERAKEWGARTTIVIEREEPK